MMTSQRAITLYHVKYVQYYKCTVIIVLEGASARAQGFKVHYMSHKIIMPIQHEALKRDL